MTRSLNWPLVPEVCSRNSEQGQVGVQDKCQKKKGGFNSESESEGYPQPIERNRCQHLPSMRVVSLFLLIRMADRGGFSKFGGK